MARRRLTLVAAAAAALLAAGPASYAATGSPPVTAPDHVTLHAGEGAMVDVTANDTDPDGDRLSVCRLQPHVPRALAKSVIQGGRLLLFTMPGAHGTYTLTYYACDNSYLSAGTLTVKVRPARPTLEVIPLEEPPGRVRIVNTFDKGFHCQWHPADSQRIEGKVFVPARSTVVIRVHEASFVVDCEGSHMSASFGFEAARGRVHRLP